MVYLMEPNYVLEVETELFCVMYKRLISVSELLRTDNETCIFYLKSKTDSLY